MATTARGWPYPVGTDKVVDGDNQMKAIADKLDAVSGATLIRTVPIATADNQINTVFTNLYPWYRIIGMLRVASANGLNIQLSTGGVPNATANGYGNSRIILATASTLNPVYAAGTAFTLSGGAGTQFAFALDFYGLQDSTSLAMGTGILNGFGISGGPGSQLVTWSGHFVTAATLFDGFRLYSGAVLTGTVSVYGMR